MKKSLYIIFILTIFSDYSFALNRGNVQIIEATENIQYLSQKITTDYFRLYNRPNDLTLQNKFKENIEELQKNIEKIAHTTQNPVTINILNFYRYRLAYIKELPIKHSNHMDANFIFAASEYFLEGARSIAEQHKYKFSKEESMLVHCKELKYLVENTSKYYMAYQIGLQNKNTTEMYQTIQDINSNLKDISHYNYPHNLKIKLDKIKDIWKYNQTFFQNLEKTSFPTLVLTSNTYIKTLLNELAKYHKQNL